MTYLLSKIRRRQALQMLAGASGAALLHACNAASTDKAASETPAAADETASSADSAMSLTLGTISWIGQVPIYIAQEKGFYEEAGLDFNLRLFGSGSEYMSAFLTNQLDGVSPVSSEAIIMKAQGKDYKIVLVQDNSVGGDGILAKDSIKSIADFKGKKVAVDTSGVSYFFLLQVLKEAGLSKDDITAVNTEPAAAAAAFQANSVDIAVTYAPYLKQADDAVEDGRIIYDSSKMPTAITDLYLFDTAYTKSNPEAVQAFVDATLKGLQFLKDNPEEGIAIGSKALEATPEDVAADLQGIKLPDKETNLKMLAQPEDDLFLANSLEELAAFLLSEGQIETSPGDWTTVIDPQFVEAAKL